MLQIKKITEPGPELDLVRQLILEYARELKEDLCFQGFEEELQHPLKKYGPPAGSVLLALYEEEPAGCIALQPLPEKGDCEMKRLYVRPAFRRHRIGYALTQALLQEGVLLGYKKMKLDTLERLGAAIALYTSLGFDMTKPYYTNPLPGVVYMEKYL